MAEKAKFDREAAFKSIIGAGRQSENAVVAEEKNATATPSPYCARRSMRSFRKISSRPVTKP